MRKSYVTILLLLICCLLLQCSRTSDTTAPTTPDVRTPAQLTQTEKDLVESVNRFSFKLFRAINAEADPDKNVFVSPLSVSYALGMLRNGADGSTRAEIDSVLEIAGVTIDDANKAYKSLTTILTQADSAVVFNVANSFWSRIGLPVQPTFVDACQNYFGARVEEVDFADPATAEAINDWVNENTAGLIPKIVDPPIRSDMAAILLNALYFKGGWTFPFDTSSTLPGGFLTPAGSAVTCDFMEKNLKDDAAKHEDDFRDRPPTFFRDSTVLALTLPYGKQGFRMTIVLPNATTQVDDFISGLTQEKWSGWQSSSKSTLLWFLLPKFEFEFDTKLNNVLISLGMPSSFGDNAEFSNLFADVSTCISEVKHKAFVKVDEKGTSAAAVTSIGIIVTVGTGPVRFNRPFFFVIHEIESGAVLFMGKIVNPTLKS